MSCDTDKQPILRTERLILRPFVLEDASVVQRLAGDRAVADTTLAIPHPYEDGVAEAWIAAHCQQFQERKKCIFAVTLRDIPQVIGAVELGLTLPHARGELGYSIGRTFWNRGYCTEAAQAVVDYGFSALGLHRIQGRHLTRNPASGRVLLKLGMHHEGRLRQHRRAGPVFEDVDIYGALNTHRPLFMGA